MVTFVLLCAALNFKVVFLTGLIGVSVIALILCVSPPVGHRICGPNIL